MSALLFALAVALPAAPSETVARSEFSLTLEAGRDLVLPAGSSTPAGAGGGAAMAALTIFPRGVRDDPTPIALQPFLQRASSLTLGASLHYLDAPLVAAGGDLDASAHRARVGASAEVFLTSFVALTAGAGYLAVDATPRLSPWWAIPLQLGVALRIGPLRVAVGYDGAYLYGEPLIARGRVASRVTTDLRAVLVNHIDLALGVLAGEGRVEAYVDAAYYPSRRLGLTAGGFGGGHDGNLVPVAGDARVLDGRAPIELPGAAHFGCRIGFSYWPTRALGVAVRYQATWLSGDSAGVTDQRGVLTLVGRAP